ncbi:MAG: nicotinate-nucleotide adenylyltransferase [Clostridia bacterium]|nr:nicotinate-nucleotide adenylyltransferase [Clostridia bacterium]
MLRVGVYGGAFSPIHKGHVEAAKAFMRQMWLDVLFVIPTGLSPHKEMDNSASAEDRMEMCRLAFRDVEGVIVSDIEIKRDGKSYSIDTLRHMSCEDQRLFMLCGTDMMLTLGDWDDADEIFKLCYPVYIRREEDRALDAKIIEKNTEYFEKYGKYVIKLDSPVIDISSTELRAKMKNGEDVSAYVDAEVLRYIQEKGLYQ